jgi:long-chain acyl-CoA synthetase
MPNSINWFVTDLALIQYNLVGVIMHATLSPDDLAPLIAHAEITCLVTSLATLQGLLAIASKIAGSALKTVVVVDENLREDALSHGALGDCGALWPGVRVVLFGLVAKEGEALRLPFEESDPTSLLNITFTSGSTGTPKGSLGTVCFSLFCHIIRFIALFLFSFFVSIVLQEHSSYSKVL